MTTVEANTYAKGSSAEATERAEKLKNSFPSRLLAFIYNLDVEFPLSGGESSDHFSSSMSYLGHESAQFVKGTDIHFPLSGGE